MSEAGSISDKIAALPIEQLRKMAAAGEEVRNCNRVLKKTKANIVGEVLKNQGTFYLWNHYPKGEVIDWESHSQYYYHAHPKKERPGEHGHFHVFLRYAGMPADATPTELIHEQKENKDRVGAHLVAISMDKKGQPGKLFTTNRWVTDETWYDAKHVIKMVDRFVIDHTFPAWSVNIWLSNLLVLFRPQILDLLYRRDEVIADAMAKAEGLDVFEDRALEVTSEIAIDVGVQIDEVTRALAKRAA